MESVTSYIWIFQFIGFSAIFLFAASRLSQEIQYFASFYMRKWIKRFTKTGVSSYFSGILLAVSTGSYAAVTLMLVGFANARLIAIKRILALGLGTMLGSTFMVQVITLPVAQASYFLMAFGFVGRVFFGPPLIKRTNDLLFFLGLLLYSMSLIQTTSQELKSFEWFQASYQYIVSEPFFLFLFFSLLASFLHSSTASLAILISFFTVQGGSLAEAFPAILGANLGTAATALFASFDGGRQGRRAALGLLCFKFLGVIFILPFVNWLVYGVISQTDTLSRQIANFHTFYNLIIGTVLFFLIQPVSRFTRRILRESKQDRQFKLLFLEKRSLGTPEVCLIQARQEVQRMSSLVEKMIQQSFKTFQKFDAAVFLEIERKDKVVDFLNKKIKFLLTKLPHEKMTSDQVQEELLLLHRINDLESVGDIIDKNILPLISKYNKKGYFFSDVGWEDLKKMHRQTMSCFTLSNNCFFSQSEALVPSLKAQEERVNELYVQLSEAHVKRLHEGLRPSLATSSVHMDLLGYYQRIAQLSAYYLNLAHYEKDE